MKNPHRPENITIARAEYHRLKRAQAMLSALEAGGVDNWDWHSEAYRDYAQRIKGQPWDDPDTRDDDDAQA